MERNFFLKNAGDDCNRCSHLMDGFESYAAPQIILVFIDRSKILVFENSARFRMIQNGSTCQLFLTLRISTFRSCWN